MAVQPCERRPNETPGRALSRAAYLLVALLALGQDHHGDRDLAFELVLDAEDRALHNAMVSKAGLLKPARGEAVACHVEDVVGPRHNV